MSDFGSRILVTGANGFVGRCLVAHLVAQGHTVRAVQRRGQRVEGAELIEIPDFTTYSDWEAALTGVRSVIHVAGIINVAPEQDAGPEMMRVNRDLTRILAERSAAHGVERFIFLSSMSVFGAQQADTILRPNTQVIPDGPYPESKYAGEQAVEMAAVGTDMKCINVRPPMVVGQGTKGTFYTMSRALARVGISPFGRFDSPYPIVSLQLLCKSIAALATHPDVEGGVYMPQEMTTECLPSIIDKIATVDGRTRPRHLRIPRPIVSWMMRAIGRGAIFEHVTGGLRVSDPRMENLSKGL